MAVSFEDDRKRRLLEARLNSSSLPPSPAPAVNVVPLKADDSFGSFSSGSGGVSLGSDSRLSLSKRHYAPKRTPKKKRRRKIEDKVGKMKNGTLTDYFKRKGEEEVFPSFGGNVCDTRRVEPHDGSLTKKVAQLLGENKRLQAETEKRKNMNEMLEKVQQENKELKEMLKGLQGFQQRTQTLKAELEQTATSKEMTKNALITSMREVAALERTQSKRAMNEASERIGRILIQRIGPRLQETWRNGKAFTDLENKVRKIQTEREKIEKLRRDLVKTRNAQIKAEAQKTDSSSMLPPTSNPMVSNVPYEKTVRYKEEQEEVYKLQSLALKREEANLVQEKFKLDSERELLVREAKRQKDEASSTFSNFPVLHDRYLLLNLIGRGGFSEVFKAFDLDELEYVACKIHQLNPQWPEQKKANYVRHSTREYNIHKSLNHPRVIRLIDVFEIDENSFCTVLEFCQGTDLDAHLRTHKVLAEREARSIISQVCAGLAYLSEQKERIIHYDLKPGNILYHQGEVRITDFGLSKVMDENTSTSEGMELTSQGAGTMWYLPPECFEDGKTPPRISSKVDVWSAGVILYQMLFGRKPFGHNQSQQKIVRNNTISRATLHFPTKPLVSEHAKDFIRRCLTPDQAERPDIHVIQQHAFLRGYKKC